MTVSRALRYYLKSKTNLVVFACCAIAGVLGLLLRPGGTIPALAAVTYVAVSAGLAFSRRGAAEIVKERNRETLEEGLEKLDAAVAYRDRLRFLRIGDDDVGKALRNYLLVSGKTLEAAKKARWYDPRVVENIEQAYEACARYLETIDEMSSAARYGSRSDSGSADVGRSAATFLYEAGRRLTELRKTGLPDADDVDSLLELEGHDKSNE